VFFFFFLQPLEIKKLIDGIGFLKIIFIFYFLKFICHIKIIIKTRKQIIFKQKNKNLNSGD
jgi:hypothetical protein